MAIDSSKNEKRYDIYAFTLFLVFAVYSFYGLWGGSLYAWDEAIYGEVAREIVKERMGWLTLHYNYQPWFHKPPLCIWLTALSLKSFGVNEFAVRFWSALFGVSTTVLLYFFSKKLFLSERVAFFSSLALLGFSKFVNQSKLGMMDAPLSFFVLLSIFFFWIGRKKKGYLFFVGICTGTAFMIKGFAAFQIPAIVIFFALIAGEAKHLLNSKFFFGFLGGTLLCLPWHIYQYIVNGKSFLDEYFMYHILRRALEPLEGHQEGPFYYFGIVFWRNLPGIMSLFTIPYIVLSACREKDSKRKTLDQSHDLKEISLLAKSYNGKSDTLYTYDVPEVPVISFYSERKLSSVNRADLLKIASDVSQTDSFVCLMSKADGFYKKLKDMPFGLDVLKETEKFILYKKRLDS